MKVNFKKLDKNAHEPTYGSQYAAGADLYSLTGGERILFEPGETKMIHTEGSILIDDYAHNLREWESEGGISVRFSPKRNGKGFLVVDKLDQIIDMF